jgi:hypothetical protein
VQHDYEQLRKERREDYEARMRLFVVWAVARPEQNIGVVSHGCIYDWLFDSHFGLIGNVCLEVLGQHHLQAILDRASL